MPKEIWKPSTLLNPVPAVLVTCADSRGNPNIFTVAWAGTINTQPPMLSISIRKERYSYQLIKEQKEFAVNLTTESLVRAVDYCGVKSGREVDKFAEMKLTPEKANQIAAPLLLESPVNLECTVKDILPLGTHDLFIGEILCVHVDDHLLDANGKLCLEKAKLICFSHGEYWSLHQSLGYFGFSVTKRKNLKRNTKK